MQTPSNLDILEESAKDPLYYMKFETIHPFNSLLSNF